MSFKRLGLMLDCSRNAVRSVSTVKKFIDIMSKMGYNTLMLYTEDTYEIKNQPYFGYLRGRYSQEEIKEIDTCCAARGVELIPCIQTLAHLNGMIRWNEYADVVDIGDTLLAGEDKTYELIDDMLKTVSEAFSTNIVHIGMDEAGLLGLGEYRKKNGYTEQKEIMKYHLERVAKIADKYGLKPLIWSDMLFQFQSCEGTAGDILPQNVTPVYWDYYSTEKAHFDEKISEHKQFGKPFWFAGALWTWMGFTPHNMYSIDECKAAIQSCGENGVENIFFTMWGDDGAEASPFSVLPAMYCAARFAEGEYDEAKIKQGFKELIGIDFDDFVLLDIPDITNSGENHGKVTGVNKYTLYNDYFLGIYDSIIDGAKNEIYHKTAKNLGRLSENGEYRYIFRTVQSLCNVLAIKNDLGIRTRKAYKSGGKEALQALLEDYNKTENALKVFYEDFRLQWYKENKPFGFEVHDARIGGLILRTQGCRRRLEAYIAGEIDCIEELEEKILDPECREEGKREIIDNAWRRNFLGVL